MLGVLFIVLIIIFLRYPTFISRRESWFIPTENEIPIIRSSLNTFGGNLTKSRSEQKETYTNNTHGFTFTYTSPPGLLSIRCSKGEVTSKAGQEGDDSIAFVPRNPDVVNRLCISDPDGAYHPVVVEVVPGNSATAQELERWSFAEWTISVDTVEVGRIIGVRATVAPFVIDPEGSGFGYPGIEQVRIFKGGNTYLFTLGNSDEPTYRTLYNEILESFAFED
jgi:hypothetical protein